MPPAVELWGAPASPGVASGPLVRVRAAAGPARIAGAPGQERQALKAAIRQAIAGLNALIAKIGEEGGDIVAFQIAMLEDDELSRPALEAIEQGTPADTAWRTAVDAQVADYEASGDDYFRARSADLCDLRDRVIAHLASSESVTVPAGAVLVGEDVAPSRFLETDWKRGGGIVLTGGSSSSHVAILARARGVPMVVALGNADFGGHGEALVDGASGRVVLSPDDETIARFATIMQAAGEQARREAAYLNRPAMTADGTPVSVLVNVAGPADLAGIDPSTCDGIGLMRTEFLFRDGAEMPDEEAQYRAYRQLLEWAGDKPVTIRTLDAGGDKPIAGLTPVNEANTFLGLRGIRLSLLREDVFRPQLRALARAAVHGHLKVMWPMVTVPGEIDRAAALFEEELAALAAAGIACARPKLGMMVEVPAPAIAPDLYGAAEFFSIGSNDLIQYVAAAARDNGSVAALAGDVMPVIERLIAGIAAYGRDAGIEVSLCGELAGETAHIPALLRSGLASLSVAPAALARVKAAVAGVNLGA